MSKSITLQKSRKSAKASGRFTAKEINRFREGDYFTLYEKLGSKLISQSGRKGASFALWAPQAKEVSVVGDFNGWRRECHQLVKRNDASGIWEGFVPDAKKGQLYKYSLVSRASKNPIEKIDPFAYHFKIPPDMASVLWDLQYQWHDAGWIKKRRRHRADLNPVSIYEMHLGSWRRGAGKAFLNYREIADQLIPHIKELGFTHVEIMPVMEHPYYVSWGYQTLGYFAPSSRYGTPQDFMYFIDQLHRHDIGVILDWVPSHFPCDSVGLDHYDGSRLYEMEDIHPDWKSNVFNIGKNEVINFLISSALFWIEKFHADGIRVDAVASMLYLDYSRAPGTWQPNFFGGHENLESIAFLRNLNDIIREKYPHIMMMAEESTAWRDVSRPSSGGGLSFDMKWNMGWMHDALRFFKKSQQERLRDFNEITFCFYYAFNESYCLPLSHDEVVYGKASLLGKMPGKDKEKISNLKLLYAFMFAHPGKKLLFMGAEIGPWKEWGHDGELEWDLLQYDRHQGIYRWLCDLNALYKEEPALYEQDFNTEGLQWLDLGKDGTGVIAFIRKGLKGERLMAVLNFTDKKKSNYRIAVPRHESWQEILNSDDKKYFGVRKRSKGRLRCETKAKNGFAQSIVVSLPALSAVFLKPVST